MNASSADTASRCSDTCLLRCMRARVCVCVCVPARYLPPTETWKPLCDWLANARGGAAPSLPIIYSSHSLPHLFPSFARLPFFKFSLLLSVCHRCHLSRSLLFLIPSLALHTVFFPSSSCLLLTLLVEYWPPCIFHFKPIFFHPSFRFLNKGHIHCETVLWMSSMSWSRDQTNRQPIPPSSVSHFLFDKTQHWGLDRMLTEQPAVLQKEN